MSLADQISATAQAGPGWQECSVSWALRVLPPADAAALRQVLAAPTPPRYYELEAALTDGGYPVASGALSRHCRGRCTCDPR